MCRICIVPGVALSVLFLVLIIQFYLYDVGLKLLHDFLKMVLCQNDFVLVVFRQLGTKLIFF